MKKLIVGLAMFIVGISSIFAILALKEHNNFLYAAYGYYNPVITYPEFTWFVLGVSIFSAIGLVIALIGAFTREKSNK